MKTLILSSNDVQHLVNKVGIDKFMNLLIERLFTAFAEFDETQTEIPLRTGFYYENPAPGLVEWMPLFQRGQRVLMKIVGYHPQNPAKFSLPTIVSTMSLLDVSTGHLAALIDGTLLTAMRTGAASAVATRIMAREDSSTLGLIGCGAQAVTQFHAISQVRNIRKVLVYDIERSATASFASRVSTICGKSTPILAKPIDEIVDSSDVLAVATTVDVNGGPVMPVRLGRPWLHVNACGSDFPGKIELPVQLLRESFVCPDNLDQALKEGECQQLELASIGGQLAEVAREADAYASLQSQRTVFDSTGWALEDHVAVTVAMELARDAGVGREIEIESIPNDPRNPYEFLNEGKAKQSLSDAVELLAS